MSSKRKQPDGSSTTQKRKTVTLETKLNIVWKFVNGMKICEIARKLDFPQTTVRTIVADKERILEAVKNAQSLNSSVIRKRHGIVAEMETLLKVWCDNQVRVMNCPVDQTTISNEAKLIFARLKEEAGDMVKDESFVASNGWFCRFKNRCNWDSIAATGEEASANNKSATSFPENLKEIIEEEGYSAKTVFNVNETGLFWKKMPKRTFIARQEKMFPGFKVAKDRLTVMLGGNAAGDCKLKPLLIYRSENPRALKHKSKSALPVIWKSNRMAWVTASVFEDWFGHHFIPEVERYCSSQNLPFKVILLLDNAPGHPQTTLVNFDPRVKVIFLPPNITSLIQPMNQAVIKTFKAYYTRDSFAHLNEAMKLNSELSVEDAWKEFNVLDAVRIIGDSWAEVDEKTMNSVWKKLCPFFFNGPSNMAPETEGYIQAIEETLSLTMQLNLEVEKEDITELLESHNQELTVDELIEIREQNAVEEDEDEESVPAEKEMTIAKLMEGLDLIEHGMRILEDIDSNEERVSTIIHGIKRLVSPYEEILREKKKSLSRQMTVLDFWKPSTSK